MLKNIICEVCGVEFKPFPIDYELHPTNWSTDNYRTANVCSTECQGWFKERTAMRLRNSEIDRAVRLKRASYDEEQQLEAIRKIINDSEKSMYDKLSDIEDMFAPDRDE